MPSNEAAKEVLDAIPTVMRVIRSEVRNQRKTYLSVPQFRTLAFLEITPGATLSEVAEHVGLTLPAMSRLVDGLVTRDLIARSASHDDRRRVDLSLTVEGKSILLDSRRLAQARLAEYLAPLSAVEKETVVRAMRLLKGIFASSHHVPVGASAVEAAVVAEPR